MLDINIRYIVRIKSRGWSIIRCETKDYCFIIVFFFWSDTEILQVGDYVIGNIRQGRGKGHLTSFVLHHVRQKKINCYTAHCKEGEQERESEAFIILFSVCFLYAQALEK